MLTQSIQSCLTSIGHLCILIVLYQIGKQVLSQLRWAISKLKQQHFRLFNPTQIQTSRGLLQAARWSTQNQCPSSLPWTDLGPRFAFVRSFVVLSENEGPFRRIDFGLPNASFEDPRLVAIDDDIFAIVVSVAQSRDIHQIPRTWKLNCAFSKLNVGVVVALFSRCSPWKPIASRLYKNEKVQKNWMPWQNRLSKTLEIVLDVESHTVESIPIQDLMKDSLNREIVLPLFPMNNTRGSTNFIDFTNDTLLAMTHSPFPQTYQFVVQSKKPFQKMQQSQPIHFLFDSWPGSFVFVMALDKENSGSQTLLMGLSDCECKQATMTPEEIQQILDSETNDSPLKVPLVLQNWPDRRKICFV